LTVTTIGFGLLLFFVSQLPDGKVAPSDDSLPWINLYFLQLDFTFLSLYLGDCPYLVASWFEKILDIWISGCFDGLALLPDPVMHTSGLSNLHPPLIFFRFGDYSFT
jgi:hypothetical protein